MDFYENTTANIAHYLVHLPSVRVLRLNHLAYETVAALPQLLRTPALVDLSVSFENDDDFNSPLDSDEDDEEEKPVTDHRTEMVTGLVSFIQQSKATVRRLLRKLKISSRGLERLLSYMPSVTDLALICVTMVNTLFRPVKYVAPDVKYHVQLLPRLDSLRLCFMPDHFPYEEVCDFFIHRATSSPNIGRLKVLRLETDPETAEGYDSITWGDLRRAVLKLSRLGVDAFVCSAY
jgi:hypothetical protein